MTKPKIIVRVDPDLEDLIPEFMAMRRKDVNSIREALQKGDIDTIEMLGHSMKGSGGGYGFDHITEIGRVIESSAGEPDLEEISRRVDELADYLERVEIVYE